MGTGAAGVHLIGGGADCRNADDLVSGFAAEAVSHAAANHRAPRLALVMVDRDGRAESLRHTYTDPLDHHVPGGFEYVDLRLDGGPCQNGPALRRVDGIVVAGGPTRDYHTGLQHLSEEIKRALADAVPYLGFSAGALIAAPTAVLGGWQDSGRRVCDQDWSEGLNELTLAPGLGIVDFTVDVHTTEGGLLTRAAAAALRPECDLVAAIDEATVLSLPFGSATSEATVSGDGFVWWLSTAASGIVATRQSSR